jgi:hypothetical protein
MFLVSPIKLYFPPIRPPFAIMTENPQNDRMTEPQQAFARPGR